MKPISHTQISNEFLDNHMSDVSGSATKVFMAVSRKTIGWHKDTDSVSVSQIMAMTGLSNRVAIKAIRELENRELIVVDRFQGKSNTFTLNYTSDEKSQVNSEPVTKGHTTYDEKSQVPMTKSHTQKKDKETNKRNICEFPQQTGTLFNTVKNKFHEINDSYYHDGKEAKNIKKLIERADAVKHDVVTVIDRFKKIVDTAKEQFWKEQPLTPSRLLSLYDSVIAKKIEAEEPEETMEERLARIDRMKAEGTW